MVSTCKLPLPPAEIPSPSLLAQHSRRPERAQDEVLCRENEHRYHHAWKGGRDEEGVVVREVQSSNGYRKTPTGELLSVGNLYRVNPPLPEPPSPRFLSLVCNIELFSKRMNISCMVFFLFVSSSLFSFFYFLLLFFFFFFLLKGRNEVISEGGGTGWFCISHPQLPTSIILVEIVQSHTKSPNTICSLMSFFFMLF